MKYTKEQVEQITEGIAKQAIERSKEDNNNLLSTYEVGIMRAHLKWILTEDEEYWDCALGQYLEKEDE